MRFILIDSHRQQNAISHLLNIPLNGKHEVYFKKADRPRTLKQNNTCHGWLQVISDETGNTLESLKRQVKRAGGFYHTTINDYGGVDRDYISTADFTVEQMIEYMTAIEMLAMQLQIQLPMPDDYKQLKGK